MSKINDYRMWRRSFRSNRTNVVRTVMYLLEIMIASRTKSKV